MALKRRKAKRRKRPVRKRWKAVKGLSVFPSLLSGAREVSRPPVYRYSSNVIGASQPGVVGNTKSVSAIKLVAEQGGNWRGGDPRWKPLCLGSRGGRPVLRWFARPIIPVRPSSSLPPLLVLPRPAYAPFRCRCCHFALGGISRTLIINKP
jgi:hypothetical protein